MVSTDPAHVPITVNLNVIDYWNTVCALMVPVT